MTAPDKSYNVNTYDKQGGDERVFESGGTARFKSGAALVLESGSTFTNGAVTTAPGSSSVAKVPLAALDTAGGVLAWANPVGADIIITRVVIDTTTKSTGASTVDAGVAANGTTSANNLLTGLDTGTSAGTFDNITDVGASGKSRQKMSASQFVTVSKASGACAGLVGNAYIHYTVA